jgi:hypothetical protein
MNGLIFTFGKTIYHVENPAPSWHQSLRRFDDRSPMDPVECDLCKGTVTFVFPARNLELARHASNYMNPVGVRCDCFFGKRNITVFGYQDKLTREPLNITLATPNN